MATKITPLGFELTGFAPATCADLDTAVASLKKEKDRTAQMTPAQLETEYKQLVADGKDAKEKVEKIKAALQQGSFALAKTAIKEANAIAVRVAGISRDPKLILGATGVRYVIDTSEFIWQVFDVEDHAEVQRAAAVLAGNRARMIMDLKSALDPTKTMNQRLIELGTALARAGAKIYDGATKVQELKAELESAQAALAGLEAAIAKITGNESYRKYRAAMIDGHIAFLQLVKKLYVGTDCQTLDVGGLG